MVVLPRERFKETFEPGRPEPEERVKAVVWPRAKEENESPKPNSNQVM